MLVHKLFMESFKDFWTKNRYLELSFQVHEDLCVQEVTDIL